MDAITKAYAKQTSLSFLHFLKNVPGTTHSTNCMPVFFLILLYFYRLFVLHFLIVLLARLID